MAESNRLSIDEKFRQQSYFPNSWGVKNAELQKITTGVTRGQAANTPNRPRQRFQNENLNQYKYIGSQEAANDVNAPQSRQNKRVEKRFYSDKPLDTNIISLSTGTAIFARGRALFFMLICINISFFLSIFQAVFLMLGFTMLGMASQTEVSWNAWLAERAARFGGWLAGFEYPDLMALATGSFLLAGIIGLVSLGGFALFAVFIRLRPLNGHGAGLKTGCFILGIILSMVPGGNIPWILSIFRHPK